MTEKLKTLEDMDLGIDNAPYKNLIDEPTIKDNIRAEAIKWIKALKYHADDIKYGKEQCRKYFHQFDGMDLEQWIIDFFNITEEEMNEEEIKWQRKKN